MPLLVKESLVSIFQAKAALAKMIPKSRAYFKLSLKSQSAQQDG